MSLYLASVLIWMFVGSQLACLRVLYKLQISNCTVTDLISLNMTYRTDFVDSVAFFRTYFLLVFTVRLRTHTHGLAIDICPFVRLSNAWIVTKRNNNLSIFQHHIRHSDVSSFLRPNFVILRLGERVCQRGVPPFCRKRKFDQ